MCSHPRPGAPRTPPGRRARAGRALVELLVAAFLLVVAGTGALQALEHAERAARRARDAAAAESLAEARVDGWSAMPCVSASGAREVGVLREAWRVAVGGGVATLTDSVAAIDGAPAPRAGAVAVAPCTP